MKSNNGKGRRWNVLQTLEVQNLQFPPSICPHYLLFGLQKAPM
jgi:hypothetical protein